MKLAEESGIIKNLLFVALFVFIIVPVITLGDFGNLICIGEGCEDDEGKEEDVVSYGLMRDISARMEQLRVDANGDSDFPGENYGTFTYNLIATVAKANGIEPKVNVVEGEGDEIDIESTTKKEDVEKKAAESTSVPVADYKQWLVPEAGVDLEGLNQGFLNRLAYIGQKNNKKIPVTSGHRSFEKQKELYQAYLNGTGNLAAKPGHSRHNYGFAADVGGWLRTLPESAILPYGLHKPVKTENWHIEPVETRGKSSLQLKEVKVDGLGANVDPGAILANIGPQLTVSEAYVHLIALAHIDEYDLTYFLAPDLELQEKKGTMIGKSWTLAKALEKEIKAKKYDDKEINKRAEKEKWKSRQYMKLARWEIQKCYLIGDKSEKGFWEKFVGGPTPCKYIKDLTGENIVPVKYQGVISQTTTKKQCEKEVNDKCEKYKEIKTVVYQDPQDIIYNYAEISLMEDHTTFKPVAEEVLQLIFERIVGAQGVGKGGAPAVPPYIVPLEKGTYDIQAEYGTTSEKNDVLGGTQFINENNSTAVFSSTSGKVVGSYKRDGGNVVLVKNNIDGYVEYSGLSEVLVSKDKSLAQGQLIGNFKKGTILELKICTDANNSAQPTCKSTTDPRKDPANLKFEPGIDAEVSKKRESEYTKWKSSKTTIYMPGFNPLSTLGSITAQHESGGDAGLCVHNKGDAGGLSCGAFQIANNPGTMTEFFNWLKPNYPQFHKQLASVPRNLSAMKPAWRAVYDSDKEGFLRAQQEFIVWSHYTSVQNIIIKKYGFDANTRSRAVQEMMYSFGTQHRYNTPKIFGGSVGSKWRDMNDEQIINAMYDYRIAHWSKYARRYREEREQILNLYRSETK